MKITKPIENVCKNNTAYTPRANTDILFELPDGVCKFTGIADDQLRFIENNQLIDAPLWKIFVDQFRSNVDDHDLGWRGEYWGKMMRGACFTYSYTQNEELYKVLENTVRDLFTTQDKFGRFSTYSIEKEFDGWDIWSRKYILLGFQYFCDICKDENLIDEIKNVMCRHADYIMSKLGKKEDGKKLITEATRNWFGVNSSSILEPFVRLYNITGEQKYFDFAQYIVDCGGSSVQNIFELAFEGKVPPYQWKVVKAYELMSCFEGLLEFYRVTNIEKWKKAVVNLTNLIIDSDITIIGSSGCTHELFDHSAVMQTGNVYPGIMQETCVTVTWMKFCFQALCVTGDPMYIDQIEHSAYNALYGSINNEKNTCNGGLPFDSYSPLLMHTRGRQTGGRKNIQGERFYGCCAAIGAAGTGLVPHMAVMTHCEGLAINMFLNGEIKAATPENNKVVLNIESNYPLEGNVKITLSETIEENYKIFVRIPKWSKKSVLKVNGEKISSKCGKYAELERTWKNGDVIELSLDMRGYIVKPNEVPADENSSFHIALMRGPIVLGRDARLKGKIDEVVDIACDKNGYVELMPTNTATFKRDLEFSVKQNDGSSFIVCDYASCGKTWQRDSIMTAWMPTKDYWSFCFCKPVKVINHGTKKGCFINSKNILTSADGSDKAILHFERVACDVFRIKFNNSEKYLTMKNIDGKSVVSEEDKCECTAQLWFADKFIQNLYKFQNLQNSMYLNQQYATNDLILVPESVDPNQLWELSNDK